MQAALRPSRHDVVKPKDNYGAEDGQQDAPERQAVDAADAELVADEAADDRADDPDDDVHDDARTRMVDELARDEAGDKAKNDPGNPTHDVSPKKTRATRAPQ